MTNQFQSVWSNPKSIDTLRTMWPTNASLAEIAAAIGTTRKAITGKRQRLGLPPRDPNINAKVGANARWIKERDAGNPVNKWLPKVTQPWRYKRLAGAELLAPDSNPVPLEYRMGCCFPINDGGPFLFCNAPTSADYCEFHKTMMFEPRKKK